MTLQWIEGFEKARHGTVLARTYTEIVGQAFALSTLSGRRGGFGVVSSDLAFRTPELVSPDENSWVAGFAFAVPTLTGLSASPVSIPYVSFRSAAGEQLRMEFIDAGPGTSGASKPGGEYFRIRVMRGATEIARSDQTWIATTLSQFAWVYFEFKTTINTGVSGSFEVRWHKGKDKTQTITWDNSVSGIDTADQGVAGADRFEISWVTGSGSILVGYDDFYILDSTGSRNNDFLGEVSIEGLDVEGVGATDEWVLAQAVDLPQAWNEAAASQNMTLDDERVTSDTVGDITLATITDLVVARATTIVGVRNTLYGKMETSGNRDLQFFYRKTTGTPAQIGGALISVNSTSIAGFSEILEDDPNTGVAWVIADIDGLQIGVELDA